MKEDNLLMTPQRIRNKNLNLKVILKRVKNNPKMKILKKMTSKKKENLKQVIKMKNKNQIQIFNNL
jgi:hypothetical protein